MSGLARLDRSSAEETRTSLVAVRYLSSSASPDGLATDYSVMSSRTEALLRARVMRFSNV